ncbi:hypothetical protein D3C73_1376350 [compost metagenome]
MQHRQQGRIQRVDAAALVRNGVDDNGNLFLDIHGESLLAVMIGANPSMAPALHLPTRGLSPPALPALGKRQAPR